MMRRDEQQGNHIGYSPCSANWVNARRNRCQEDLNSFPVGELEETTRTLSYYVDEDYPARPEIQ